MLKKTLVTAALLAGLSATYVFGGFGSVESASPCACCEVCACDVCVCDESGCDCGTGGECACSADCCQTCCAD